MQLNVFITRAFVRLGEELDAHSWLVSLRAQPITWRAVLENVGGSGGNRGTFRRQNKEVALWGYLCRANSGSIWRRKECQRAVDFKRHHALMGPIAWNCPAVFAAAATATLLVGLRHADTASHVNLIVKINHITEHTTRTSIKHVTHSDGESTMRKLSILAFGAVLGLSTAALAQTQTVTVDLSPISADLAAELGIDVGDLPATIDLSADVAAEVCGVDVETIADSCVASVSTTDLGAAVESEIGNNDNSARQFAPGQQEGPARDAAPGQQDGDAKDASPGQMKKFDDSAGNGKDSATDQ